MQSRKQLFQTNFQYRTIFLDMMSLGYIQRDSKKTGIPASWHNNSGRSFKTHNKYRESRDKLKMIGIKIRKHISWLSPGLHPSYSVLCSWQIIYGKVFRVLLLSCPTHTSETRHIWIHHCSSWYFSSCLKVY